MDQLIHKIVTAHVRGVGIETSLDPMPRLSGRIGDRQVLLKREDLQPVFSFKIRGALNKIASLPDEALARGVICASAGNHAQGVALAAAQRGVPATIVMPTTTPGIKVEAVKARGGNVVLHGDGFDDAYAEARRIEQETGATFIHPFDDPEVIAGQGTIGLEILRQHPGPIEAVFVAIGGGGLAAGVASVIRYLRPEIRIIGVEPVEAASMKASIEAGERVILNEVGLFADGVAVRQVGEETFRLCRELLDEVITVDTDAICAAIKDIFDDCRAVAEPAGAVALAGLKAYAARDGGEGGALIAVNSGANLNFDRLRHVAERAEIGEGREALLAVTIPERPGSYRRFISILGRRAVTEFNYRYADDRRAHIFVGVETKRAGEKAEIIAAIEAEGFPVVDMSDNEMAKLHARYMVGGRVAGGIPDEVLLRFQFPERPGALLRFLESLRPQWNITLFHYRNHGADHGRVLAGIQVPADEREAFDQALAALGYPYQDETANPAYRLFLDGGPETAERAPRAEAS
ncbi:threonine dehydratase [Enterovirga rhinocerotis]|uniref:L-threonine dehydratase n=1 Tax=Enterovirga rhinocerotis TaxID=1339210 RepID=A0A4R7C8G5_9HYPH|nr:threonine dehydratase [Enterovirga rhinocerotis]